MAYRSQNRQTQNNFQWYESYRFNIQCLSRSNCNFLKRISQKFWNWKICISTRILFIQELVRFGYSTFIHMIGGEFMHFDWMYMDSWNCLNYASFFPMQKWNQDFRFHIIICSAHILLYFEMQIDIANSFPIQRFPVGSEIIVPIFHVKREMPEIPFEKSKWATIFCLKWPKSLVQCLHLRILTYDAKKKTKKHKFSIHILSAAYRWCLCTIEAS